MSDSVLLLLVCRPMTMRLCEYVYGQWCSQGGFQVARKPPPQKKKIIHRPNWVKPRGERFGGQSTGWKPPLTQFCLHRCLWPYGVMIRTGNKSYHPLPIYARHLRPSATPPVISAPSSSLCSSGDRGPH